MRRRQTPADGPARRGLLLQWIHGIQVSGAQGTEPMLVSLPGHESIGRTLSVETWARNADRVYHSGSCSAPSAWARSCSRWRHPLSAVFCSTPGARRTSTHSWAPSSSRVARLPSAACRSCSVSQLTEGTAPATSFATTLAGWSSSIPMARDHRIATLTRTCSSTTSPQRGARSQPIEGCSSSGLSVGAARTAP